VDTSARATSVPVTRPKEGYVKPLRDLVSSTVETLTNGRRRFARLFWAAATLGLRPYPLAALLSWWTRVVTAATGPLHQLRGDPRAVARTGTPRRAYAIDVVGHALLASACGRSHRTIGADLGVPADTVRDWIRRVRARAEWLRVQGTMAAHRFDPMLPAIVPVGSPLADAVSVLAIAAAALLRRLGPIAPPWQIIAMLARGQLLAPLRSG
jgi:hypothetical protein